MSSRDCFTLQALPMDGMEAPWSIQGAEARERARIAALLHEEVGQCVAVIGLALDRWTASGDHHGQPHVDEIRHALQRLDYSWRDAVARPAAPEVVEMLPALAALCREAERGMQLRCSLQTAADTAPPTLAGARVLLHGVRELLLNVRKHAGSPWASVQLDSHGPWVEVAVRDYGSPSVPGPDRRRVRGFGLMNLKRELREVCGDMRVEELAPGRRVRLRVPTLAAVHGEGACI